MSTQTVNVRLLDSNGVDYGAVSGADASTAAGESDGHLIFTVASQPLVNKLARRVRNGLVLQITDSKRVKWVCTAPTVQGDNVVMPSARVGGDA